MSNAAVMRRIDRLRHALLATLLTLVDGRGIATAPDGVAVAAVGRGQCAGQSAAGAVGGVADARQHGQPRRLRRDPRVCRLLRCGQVLQILVQRHRDGSPLLSGRPRRRREPATDTLQEWSGNYLNWAATQTIDPFRKALTGGYRVRDTRDRDLAGEGALRRQRRQQHLSESPHSGQRQRLDRWCEARRRRQLGRHDDSHLAARQPHALHALRRSQHDTPTAYDPAVHTTLGRGHRLRSQRAGQGVRSRASVSRRTASSIRTAGSPKA